MSHDVLRCPECRTRRVDAHLMFRHVQKCKRPVCHCLAYPYPHRPVSGECFKNPEAQVRRAMQHATPDAHPDDVFLDVALSMPGKPMRAWPFDLGVKRMRERDIEADLVKRVKALGGEVRKVQWIGRRGAPDRLVMLPCSPESNAQGMRSTVWVELKAPGKKATVQQLREHDRMRAMGQRVEVVDSIDAVTELLS